MALKFKVGDKVRTTGCEQKYRVDGYQHPLARQIGLTGRICSCDQQHIYCYQIRFSGNGDVWWWRECDVQSACKFNPGDKVEVTESGTICTVTGYEKDGQVTLDDGEGEFSRPERDLTPLTTES